MNDSNPEKPQEPDEPKIIVDEDWKSQVRAEKQTLDKASAKPTAGPESTPIPEASFPMLVTMLATQTTLSLGQPAEPDAKEVRVDLGMAKYLIDTLGILEEKTQGNLTPEESGVLANVLQQLRVLFVAIQGQVQEQPPEKSSIELP